MSNKTIEKIGAIFDLILWFLVIAALIKFVFFYE